MDMIDAHDAHNPYTGIFSTARCSSSRNSLRGIQPSIHPVNILLKGGATSSFDGIFELEILV